MWKKHIEKKHFKFCVKICERFYVPIESTSSPLLQRTSNNREPLHHWVHSIVSCAQLHFWGTSWLRALGMWRDAPSQSFKSIEPGGMSRDSAFGVYVRGLVSAGTNLLLIFLFAVYEISCGKPRLHKVNRLELHSSNFTPQVKLLEYKYVQVWIIAKTWKHSPADWFLEAYRKPRAFDCRPELRDNFCWWATALWQITNPCYFKTILVQFAKPRR